LAAERPLEVICPRMMVPTIFVVSKKVSNYLEIGLIVAFWVFRADGKVDHPVHVVGLRD
jgi:hypothetical protein